MTTSSDQTASAKTRPEAKNWLEMTSQMSKPATIEFGHWLDGQLIALEARYERFVTKGSLAKKLRRGTK